MRTILILIIGFVIGWFAASYTASQYIRNGPLLDNVRALHRAADHILWRVK